MVVLEGLSPRRAAAVLALALWLLGVSFASAGEGKPDVAPAVESALSWLTLVDQGRYEASWDAGAAFFKTALSRNQWVDTLKAVRAPLGAIISREFQSAQYTKTLPGAPDGEYVVIRFLTVFQHQDSAEELVTPMRDPDGVWRVSGFYIRFHPILSVKAYGHDGS